MSFDVEIFEYATGKTVSVIGKDMSESKTERREMTGLSRCNENYGCRTVEHKGE